MENGVSHKYDLKPNLFKVDYQIVIVPNNLGTLFLHKK